MAPIVTLYNHTAARFWSGANAESDEYIINLYTVLPSNLTATTKTAAEAGATQLSTAFGYTQNAKILTSVAVSVFSVNGFKLDADDPSWTASGGDLAAAFAMCFNNTDTDDPPVFRVDFGGTSTAPDTIPLVIGWDPDGIFNGEWS